MDSNTTVLDKAKKETGTGITLNTIYQHRFTSFSALAIEFRNDRVKMEFEHGRISWWSTKTFWDNFRIFDGNRKTDKEQKAND